jgi:hypothetical protein
MIQPPGPQVCPRMIHSSAACSQNEERLIVLIAVLSKKHLLLLNESERVNMLTHWLEKAFNSPRLGAKTLDIMTLSITTVSIS